MTSSTTLGKVINCVVPNWSCNIVAVWITPVVTLVVPWLHIWGSPSTMVPPNLYSTWYFLGEYHYMGVLICAIAI